MTPKTEDRLKAQNDMELLARAEHNVANDIELFSSLTRVERGTADKVCLDMAVFASQSKVCAFFDAEESLAALFTDRLNLAERYYYQWAKLESLVGNGVFDPTADSLGAYVLSPEWHGGTVAW